MIKRLLFGAAIFVVLLALLPSAAPYVRTNAMTAEEYAFGRALEAFWAYPAAYCEYVDIAWREAFLEPENRRFPGSSNIAFSQAERDALKAELLAQPPRYRTLDKLLSDGALRGLWEMNARKITDHVKDGPNSLSNRVARLPYKGYSVWECLAGGPYPSYEDVILSWLIDSDTPDRGHRLAILNDIPRSYGVAIIPWSWGQGNLYALWVGGYDK